MKPQPSQTLEVVSKRRDKIVILADILEITRDGAKKTKIMYGANLSFVQVEKYITFMRTIHLIQIRTEHHGKAYWTTEKGMTFLREFRRISVLLENKAEKSTKLRRRSNVYVLDNYL
jgi:predicted transcriptional regulator